MEKRTYFCQWGTRLLALLLCIGSLAFGSTLSNGSSGTHYPAIAALVSIALSFLLFAQTTKNKQKAFWLLCTGGLILFGLFSLLAPFL